MSAPRNWITVSESRFPWEREALEFVRQGFPADDAYRAWTNFEFIAADGSINEVDLLLFTPVGFFLTEIKSRPGRLYGDAGAWTWETDGRLSTVENPLFATNLKAKKLRDLLQKQKAFQKKGSVPYLDALVFCSAPSLICELRDNARSRVCLRDRDASDGMKPREGILAAVKRRTLPELGTPKGTFDRPMAKAISQAMEQAGIRPSQRHRKVSDYVLGQLIGEGPGYQDWQAEHAQVSESKRRVRLYLVRTGATNDERQMRQRAALREFKLLETLQHPGILKVHGFTEHEVGPALLFEHDPLSIRLDHFLTQRADKLSVDVRLDLVRQLAEIVRFAHDKRVVHRALCPQSVLVTAGPGDRFRLKVFNWQVGYREGTTSSGVSKEVSATSHVDRLVDDASTAYMAPEALTDDAPGEHLDIFSLGATAYHIFSGQPPAANGLELSNKLRETKGLQISSILNGAVEALQYLIRYSTHPEVTHRTGSVTDFLTCLDEVENELTSPEHEYGGDPSAAQIGDLLPGGMRVLRRLGQGSIAVALLVERHDHDFVLKVASDPEHNSRVRDESDVLNKVRHPRVAEFVEQVELGDRAAFLMRPVFAEKDKRLIETLDERLRKDGRPHIDILQRFGDDILGVVCHLEEKGIPHRDIKPNNIAVGMVGRGDKLHLVLFDFSLSRTPADNIRAGTSGYLDPLLPLRKPPRWDLHAERYAAAVTLYELATGTLPKWGDGSTDPSHLSRDTEITINPEQFDPGLRERLAGFFRKSFRRDPAERFDNAEAMLDAWRNSFKGLDESGPLSDHHDESQLQELLAEATFDTQIPDLGLGTRATNVLDRANILTVEDLLTVPMRRLLRLRGVGNTTRREITSAVKILRDRLGNPAKAALPLPEEFEPPADSPDLGPPSVDLLCERILKTGSREGDTVSKTVRLMLGLNPDVTERWPSQSDVSRLLEVTRARVGQIVGKLQTRWSNEAMLTRLRNDLAEIVGTAGGVMSIPEAIEAVLLARGSSQDEPLRTRFTAAVVRAAVEVERTMSQPRLVVRRDGDCILLARTADLAQDAHRLGKLADEIADADPLTAPARVIERFREDCPATFADVPDTRLVRLAAAASQHAAVSSRQELYPRRMPALRSLKLSQGALLGVRSLTVEQIRERVSSRYPEGERLPDRPALDDLLRQAGFEYRWDASARNGEGSYFSPHRENDSLTSGTESRVRFPTTATRPESGEITPEEADARQFEEKLQRAVREGSFLSLLVNPKQFDDALTELCSRFPVELVDFEGLFLDALQGEAKKARVAWDLVLQTDVEPNAGDWDKLLMLVGRAIPVIEKRLQQADRTMLVIYAGLLARYGQMDLLSRLSQKVGRRDGIPGLWLLLPGDQRAMLDGKPVPLIGPGQRARIPESWLKNIHRGHADGASNG